MTRDQLGAPQAPPALRAASDRPGSLLALEGGEQRRGVEHVHPS
ncbi:MAG: hypothetical protein ACYCZN_16065 [Candidatus Dormibacteria bacterium]